MSRQLQKFNARVLVVEDYFVNLDLIKEMLEMMNCTVDTAEDGEQALEQYHLNSYDLILMDIQMPKKDGLQATREIRDIEKNENKKYTPIVAVTANAMEEDRIESLDSGMDDFITKPIKIGDLEGILSKYTKRADDSEEQ